ncbi:MAG: SlyX family protein [Proteobacteria bacterium]|nr:SlyX family protein [Pseudomonadota bacterium]HQR03129.1 SlyX family protein [Rhodocyclaceae bacterium]
MESRLAELEIKVSFSEDLLEQINLTVFRQQQQIDQLVLAIAELRRQLQASLPEESHSPREEIPPHY